jgi:hypothetical protein
LLTPKTASDKRKRTDPRADISLHLLGDVKYLAVARQPIVVSNRAYAGTATIKTPLSLVAKMEITEKRK